MTYNKLNRIRYQLKQKNKEQRPRLCVHKSNKHIYAQIIDIDGKVLVSTSSINMDISGYNVEGAKIVGKAIGEKAKEKNIKSVVFDRGDKIYIGRLKALAESAREFLEF